MITESKVTEIFCIADDFCKEFGAEMAKKALPSTPEAPKRNRKWMMSDSEVITILICFHFNTFRNSSITIWDVFASIGNIYSLIPFLTTDSWRSCHVVL